MAAASRAAGMNLDDRALSRLARRGSGSATRSVFGGLVLWNAGHDDASSYAEPVGCKMDLALGGAKAMVVCASWAPGPGKLAQWRTLVAARAMDSTSFMIAVDQATSGDINASGPPTGVGHSMVAGPASPRPDMRIRVPVDTPAGMETSRSWRTRVRPSPEQSLQGVTMTVP